MTLFCDESGGLSAGAMTMAGVSVSPGDADAVVARFRTVTGLRGELKGSRISSTERALFFEILMQRDVHAWVSVADGPRLSLAKATGDSDLRIYSRLLDAAVGAFLSAGGGHCADVVIDEGRYDPAILADVRGDVQTALGQWGRASLADSSRCAGIQIADIIANSMFNIAMASPRSARIKAIIAPLVECGRLRASPLPI